RTRRNPALAAVTGPRCAVCNLSPRQSAPTRGIIREREDGMDTDEPAHSGSSTNVIRRENSTMEAELATLIEKAAAALRAAGAREVYVFGSASKGKLRLGSDVDL